MDRPDQRRHTWPVKATEWDELLRELKRLATSSRKTRPILAHLQTLEQISKQKHPQVDGFCVWELTKQSNATADLNKLLQSVQRNGCLRGGELLEENRYVQLSPRLIALNGTALERTIPLEFLEQFKPLPATKGQYHLLVWLVSGGSIDGKLWSEKKLEFTKEERERLSRGKVCKTPPGPALALVVSTRRQSVVKPLTDALKGTVEIRKIVAGQSNLRDSFLNVQMARGTVIWVDDGINEIQLPAFAVAAHPESLVLVASDDPSWERVKGLAEALSLESERYCMIEPPLNGKLDTFVAKVRQMIVENRSAEKQREDCRAEWHKTQAVIGSLIDNKAIDVQIVKNMVLDPAQERANALLNKHGFSSRVDAQIEFLRVATPLYGQASEIYTLNSDRYSTFWNSDAFDEKTKQELLTLCRTVRLFLYGTPDALFRDISTLNSQSRHYQNGHAMPGDVKLLVGDWERFKLAFPEQADEDVAFIHHKSSGDWYRFFLNEREFGAQNIGHEVSDPIFTWLQRLGKEATNLAGHITDTRTDREKWPVFEYLRWEENVQQLPVFGESLKKVFFHNSRSGVHRVLTFRNDGKIDPRRFKNIVLRVHHALEKHFGDGQQDPRKKHGLKSIEYGSLVQLESHIRGGKVNEAGHDAHPNHDRKTSPGSQSIESRSREIILLHFDTIDHLQAFSDSDELRAIRRDLYRDILTALGVTVGKGPLSEPVYEAMRAAGNRFMTIYDYTDRHDLAEWIKLMRDEHEPT